MDKFKINKGKNKKLIYTALLVIVVFAASLIAFKIYNSQLKNAEDKSFEQKDSNINKNNEVSVKSLLKNAQYDEVVAMADKIVEDLKK